MLNFSKGAPVAYPVLQITGVAEVDRTLHLQTEGLNRFTIGIDSTPEGGGNTGSIFAINAYADDGTYIDTPLVIDRPGDQAVRLLRTTDSLDDYTGALIVSGGVAIQKSVNIGGSLTLGGSDGFRVDDTGNITVLRGLPISFPGIQGGADTYLKNDGSGNLSWAAASGSGSLSGAHAPLRVSGTDVYFGYVQPVTTQDPLGSACWSPMDANHKALCLQAAPMQSANIFEVQQSTGAALISVGALGATTFSSTVDSNGSITSNVTTNTYVRLTGAGGYPAVMWNHPADCGTTIYAAAGWPKYGHLGFTSNGSLAILDIDTINNRIGINITTTSVAPLDQLSFGQAPAAGATRAMINLTNSALVSGNANGTYIGANPATAVADFINYQVGGVTKFKVDKDGNVSATISSSSLSGAVSVANGGTGRISVTVGSYLVGDGTGALIEKTSAQLKTDLTLVKGDVGLDNVENTALSTWAGSTNIVTLGTIATGVWNGTAIDVAYGGTGLATVTAGSYLVGNDTGTLAEKTLAQLKSDLTLVKGDVGLGNVENTALSTWAGTTNITTLGTIATGVWNGSAIGIAYGGTGQATKQAAFDALSPLSVKGDLIVHDGTNNIAVGVGTDTYVLTADSTAPSGIKWAAASGSSPNAVLNNQANTFSTGLQTIQTSGPALALTGAPSASTTEATLMFDANAITNGNSSGTYIGCNPTSVAADLINFQANGKERFKINYLGNIIFGTPDSASPLAHSISTTSVAGALGQGSQLTISAGDTTNNSAGNKAGDLVLAGGANQGSPLCIAAKVILRGAPSGSSNAGNLEIDAGSRQSGNNGIIYLGKSYGKVAIGNVTPLSLLHVNGAISTAIATVSSDITIDSTYSTVLVDTTSAAVTVTLPAASTCTGRVYIIKRISAGSNNVTVDGNASETIDGATTVTLSSQWAVTRIQSNGTNWFVI